MLGALTYRCINKVTVWLLRSWVLLFWFCCMTLLGCVPEENLAESGSNVKSAAESRTEQQNLKRALDVLLYGWKKGTTVRGLFLYCDKSHQSQ